MGTRRRITLFEQMSAVDSRRQVAGLTLENILANQKRATAAPTLPLSQERTLLDVIREDDSSNKGKNSWKAFKAKLRRKRAGSFSATPVPIPNNTNHHRSSSESSPLNAIRYDTLQNITDHSGGSNASTPATRPQPSPRILSSPRIPSEPGRRDRAMAIAVNLDVNRNPTARERTRRLSVREAMALQDAAAAAVAAEVSAMEPARMSLMDLLEETDEAMALEISTCEEEEEEEEGEKERNFQFYCCVCMVRHKGAAFIPCGHTFCRLCSREIWVQRGNCPLCNNSISEILDIF